MPVSTVVGRDRSILPLTRAPLSTSAWTQVNTTGWTISNPNVNTLRLAWDGSGTVDWTNSVETGLALLYPVKLGTLSNAARHCRVQVQYNEATANGIGVGVGFAATTGIVGGIWVARIEDRDGSGTVRVRDDADSAAAPFSSAGQTRRGVISSEIESLTTSMFWGKAAGVVTGYNERRYAGTHVTFPEGTSVYLTIFAVGTTNVGSVDVTAVGSQFINLETL